MEERQIGPGMHGSTMEISYLPASESDIDAIRTFLADAGWAHRVDDAHRFRQLILNSTRTVVARHDERIVGFGRALCDDVSNGYLSMLAVANSFRGRGIGTEIARRLIGNDPGITWVLRAGRDSEGFWKRLGFDVSTIAMERTRKE